MNIKLTPGINKDGREYCHTCGEDITIIKGHDCRDGWEFGTVLPIKIGHLFKQASSEARKGSEPPTETKELKANTKL